MTYDIGTMVLSTPYFVGNHDQVVGWVIQTYEDFCVIQWASDKLPTSIAISSQMYHIHKAFLDLENANS